jgi:small subunit ribosomal protein S20
VPHTKSTKKRVKTNEIRRQRNVARRRRMRRAIRDLRETIAAADGPLSGEQLEQLKNVESLLDRMVTKGLIPDRRAARLKSRLTRQAEGKPATGKTAASA